MQSTTTTIRVFGAFAVPSSLAMVLVPDLLLGLLGLPPAQEPWVRVWGLEILVLGFYYLAAAAGNVRSFFVATVYGRFGFSACLLAVVLLVHAPWQVLLVGATDVSGALWTLAALRAEASKKDKQPDRRGDIPDQTGLDVPKRDAAEA